MTLRFKNIKQWMKDQGFIYTNANVALNICALYGEKEYIEYLLKNNKSINKEGLNAAFYTACVNGYTLIAELLLNNGAEVDSLDKNAFPIIFNKEYFGICKLLKEYKK